MESFSKESSEATNMWLHHVDQETFEYLPWPSDLLLKSSAWNTAFWIGLSLISKWPLLHHLETIWARRKRYLFICNHRGSVSYRKKVIYWIKNSSNISSATILLIMILSTLWISFSTAIKVPRFIYTFWTLGSFLAILVTSSETAFVLMKHLLFYAAKRSFIWREEHVSRTFISLITICWIASLISYLSVMIADLKFIEGHFKLLDFMEMLAKIIGPLFLVTFSLNTLILLGFLSASFLHLRRSNSFDSRGKSSLGWLGRIFSCCFRAKDSVTEVEAFSTNAFSKPRVNRFKCPVCDIIVTSQDEKCEHFDNWTNSNLYFHEKDQKDIGKQPTISPGIFKRRNKNIYQVSSEERDNDSPGLGKSFEMDHIKVSENSIKKQQTETDSKSVSNSVTKLSTVDLPKQKLGRRNTSPSISKIYVGQEDLLEVLFGEIKSVDHKRKNQAYLSGLRKYPSESEINLAVPKLNSKNRLLREFEDAQEQLADPKNLPSNLKVSPKVAWIRRSWIHYYQQRPKVDEGALIQNASSIKEVSRRNQTRMKSVQQAHSQSSLQIQPIIFDQSNIKNITAKRQSVVMTAKFFFTHLSSCMFYSYIQTTGDYDLATWANLLLMITSTFGGPLFNHFLFFDGCFCNDLF